MHNNSLSAVKSVALYGSRSQGGHIESIRNLVEKLLEARIRVSIERKLFDVLTEAGYRPTIHGASSCREFPQDADAAISIGGDGTFLRTAAWVGGREKPILGINTGHLGFLAETSADDAASVVELLLSGRAGIERRLLLEVDAEGSTISGWPYALNEVAFMKGAASMIDVDVKVDGNHIARYRADGLLVSSPTGSTAYNLSVGGPIMAPTLDSIVLSPIAPHTLTLRPIVIAGDSEIEATVASRAADFRLSLDGRSTPVGCGKVIKIKKAPFKVLTLRRPGENFASTLRSKLLWGS